ncbi:MAG TPA: hypothetical protein VF458_19465 [Ktedonobacteraceae bacterium]
MLLRLRSFFRNGRAIRLIIAFFVGLLLGVIAGKLGADVQNILPFLLFPLLIGALSAFTVSLRKLHPHLLTLGTGLLAWGGIGVSLLILTAQAALAPCTPGSCSSTTSAELSSLLIVYLLLGLVLVAASALITSFLLRRFRGARYR